MFSIRSAGLLFIGSAVFTIVVPVRITHAGPVVPTFTDETATFLNAPADVGSADPAEKDYGLGDLDRDGDIDVVVARRTGLNNNNGVALPNTLFMNVDGVLTDLTAELAPGLLVSNRSRDVVVEDFDNDGWLDVLVADGPSNPPVLLMNQGESAGVWQGLVVSPGFLPAGFNIDAWTVSAGDLRNDGDAYPDLFIGVRAGNDRILVNLGAPFGSWLGFVDQSARLGANASTTAVRSSRIVDMNGDGDADIVEDVTNPTGATRMLANDGTGMFTSAPQNFITGATYNFGLGDLDGNGSLDIFGVRNGLDQYRQNLGPDGGDGIVLGALFSAPNSNGFGAICRVADLNGDDTDDFLVADLDQEFPQDCSRRLKIFLNTGVSPFLIDAYPTPQPWTKNGTSDIAMIDLDGDFDLDMLIGHCTGHSVFLQDGSPTHPADFDEDGDIDIDDFAVFDDCMAGPGLPPDPTFPVSPAQCLGAFDFDDDGDVDWNDSQVFLLAYTGP